MAYWLVSGKIKVEVECWCEKCDGHPPRYGEVGDEEVEAKTPEEAAKKVLEWEADTIAGRYEVDEAEWVDTPTVKELPTDQFLRRIGAPMLLDVLPESLGHTAWIEKEITDGRGNKGRHKVWPTV